MSRREVLYLSQEDVIAAAVSIWRSARCRRRPVTARATVLPSKRSSGGGTSSEARAASMPCRAPGGKVTWQASNGSGPIL